MRSEEDALGRDFVEGDKGEGGRGRDDKGEGVMGRGWEGRRGDGEGGKREGRDERREELEKPKDKHLYRQTDRSIDKLQQNYMHIGHKQNESTGENTLIKQTNTREQKKQNKYPLLFIIPNKAIKLAISRCRSPPFSFKDSRFLSSLSLFFFFFQNNSFRLLCILASRYSLLRYASTYIKRKVMYIFVHCCNRVHMQLQSSAMFVYDPVTSYFLYFVYGISHINTVTMSSATC